MSFLPVLFFVLIVVGLYFKVISLFPQNKWYTSKNGNLYNPIFGMTICYSGGGAWALMRNGICRAQANSLQEAKQLAFQIWKREG